MKKPSAWQNPPPGHAEHDRLRVIAERIAAEIVRTAKQARDEQGLTAADKALWDGLADGHANLVQRLLAGALEHFLPPDIGWRALTLVWSHRESDPPERVAIDALLATNCDNGFTIEEAVEWVEEWLAEARKRL